MTAFSAAAASLGIEILTHHVFSPMALDISFQFKAIADAGPNIIVYTGLWIGPDVSGLFLDVIPQGTPQTASDIANLDGFMYIYPRQNGSNAAYRALQAAYQAQRGGLVDDVAYGITFADCVTVTIRGLQRLTSIYGAAAVQAGTHNATLADFLKARWATLHAPEHWHLDGLLPMVNAKSILQTMNGTSGGIGHSQSINTMQSAGGILSAQFPVKHASKWLAPWRMHAVHLVRSENLLVLAPVAREVVGHVVPLADAQFDAEMPGDVPAIRIACGSDAWVVQTDENVHAQWSAALAASACKPVANTSTLSARGVNVTSGSKLSSGPSKMTRDISLLADCIGWRAF
ncbi:hypothetical protein AMAG_18910 [Allomyces macrogynus ATCC 38327]|uniref:Uncharacterized protein n=1 Tax=Allomyces macrogynus (strain ATCC 38327) TaxID=578462 RepID=A0A0L0SJW2_ALLM3|nr:hypothetical protein AMAG_18910 [Allomyces macrogynus ATCC 38327]|eukprot:KNE62766.1 hypothetical protein AMAG_18910 [Allomyces macrogynus ATCC 38327]